jgi:NAD(P)-dependent dehydrogenase (short-subunit alcohol dehydrogenase family)
MILEKSRLTAQSLAGQVAVVSGAGRGIGVETARCLLWLGAAVILAEIDKKSGMAVEKELAANFGNERVRFVHTDVSREVHIERLKRKTIKIFGKVDIVINNATLTPMGAVKDVRMQDWDASYGVNFRAPVLMAKAFLPGMLARNYGVFACVSSVGVAYMGAYESFKAAQVHLATTLDAELEGTGVHAFTIGPGLVRTPGAKAGIEQLAPLYGKSVEEFYALSQAHIISVEEAGAGFAAAVVLAEQFRGQEIGSRQALIAAGVDLESASVPPSSLAPDTAAHLFLLLQQVSQTLKEQSLGWQERPLFERQWVLRDFKKNAGMAVEQWLDELASLEGSLRQNEKPSRTHIARLAQLESYYAHLQTLASGYEKNQQKLAEQLAIIQQWRDEITQLIAELQS